MVKIITTTIICLLLYTKSSSQDTLVYGDNIWHEIATLGETHLYQFDAQGGDVIWIRMRDVTAVDAHIQIVDSFGLILEEDFDLGGLAEIQGFIVPDTATYFIRAFDHNHNDTGEYGLSLHKMNGPQYSTGLSCYANFTDSIRSSAAINVYHFYADAGDMLSAQMRALTSHLEPEFHLYDQEGIRLAKSRRKGRRAVILHTIADTGKYTLMLIDRGGNDSDQIGFSLLKLNRQECLLPLYCGETAQQELHHMVERMPFLLEMSTGEIGLLQMRSPNPSVEIAYEIYNSAGDLVESDDGSDKMIGTILNSTEDQSYLLLVFDKHGNDLGPLGIHYESITQNICAQHILCDEQNEFVHEIDAVAHLNTYRIHGVENEPFSFFIEEIDSKLEPQIRLCNDQGEIILEESSTKKILAEGLYPSTGFFYLLVGDRSGNDTGSYSLFSNSGMPEVSLPDSIFLPAEQACTTLIAESTHAIQSWDWSTGDQTPTLSICPDETVQVGLEVQFESGCIGQTETYLQLEEPVCDVIDFNQFEAGAIPEGLNIVTISSNNNDGPNLASIFNSSHPPQHSKDLGSPHEDFNGPGKGKGGEQGAEGENNFALDKILIVVDDNIDENGDGLIDNPRPDHNGGFLFFEFHEDVFLKSIDLLNITKNGGQLFFWNRSGKMLDKIDIIRKGSNSFQSINIQIDSVARMKIHMNGTGAVDNIAYCTSGNQSVSTFTKSLQPGPQIREHIALKKGKIAAAQNQHQIKQNKKNANFSIYPNPSTGDFNINFQNRFDNPLEITLHTLSGELLKRTTIEPGATLATIRMDKSLYGPGIYLVKLKSGLFEVTRRIILK